MNALHQHTHTHTQADWLRPGESLTLDEAGHLMIVRPGAVTMRAELRPAAADTVAPTSRAPVAVDTRVLLDALRRTWRSLQPRQQHAVRAQAC